MPGVRFKIIIFILVLLCTIILLFNGCSTFNEGKEAIVQKLTSQDEMDDAVIVVEDFFNLIMEKDYESAYGYLSRRDKEDHQLQDFIEEFSDVTDIIKVELNWVEVKNNVAKVGIDILDSYDGDQQIYKDIEVSLVKEENGKWKIVFWD